MALPGSPGFARAVEYFDGYPQHSLMSKGSRAFIYQIVRSMQPTIVVEIGTYHAGTAEVIGRALWANAKGHLITVDPFGGERVPKVLDTWPDDLRRHVAFSPVNSMACFHELADQKVSVDIAFVDGNHDYGFAAYDLTMAAELVRPGGVIIMDNAEQHGVFWAAKHFLTHNPQWRVLGNVFDRHDDSDPFATMGSSLQGLASGFIVLLAPDAIEVGATPKLFDFGYFEEPGIEGFFIEPLPDNAAGTLHVHAMLVSFCRSPDENQPYQQIELRTFRIEFGQGRQFLSLPLQHASPTFSAEDSFRNFRVALSWQPDTEGVPLRLAARPQLAMITLAPSAQATG